MKRALITGITGQDGSYLSEFLLEKGYEVHGVIRRSSVDFRERIAHLEGHPCFHLHYGDLGDTLSMVQTVGKVKPDEIYNLAAQSHVQVSFDAPEYTANVDATGVLRILEAVRQCGLEQSCRIYQASTSELYGRVEQVPQNEETPFHPYSPYAVAKLYGYWIVKEYREAYGMFCCNGILFNHESERRGETFVTRKITLAAARICQGKQEKLYLGNLSSLRDWGYAKDYVECMWMILQHPQPDDYASLQEVVRRRYTRMMNEETPLPDLIITDGGRGQMEVVRKVVEDELNLHIPIAGLAKDDRHRTHELLYGFPPQVVGMKMDSPLFRLLTQIQDEVHRFAITFHRQKRSKHQVASELDEIKGIGPRTRDLLIKHFRSVKRIREATLEALVEVVGAKKANILHDALAQNQENT